MFKDKFGQSFQLRSKWTVATLIFLAAILGPFIIPGYGQSSTETQVQDSSFWLWNFLGHLHPLAVHFPVGFILLAAILELFTLKNYHSRLRSGIDVLVITGVICAIVSVILGLLLARNGDYGKNILAIHQWTGIASALLSALALYFLLRIRHNHQPQLVKIYRGVLFFTAFGVSVAGHFGASLIHGSDYLSETLPWSEDYRPSNLVDLDIAALSSDSNKLSPKQEAELSLQVRAIFAHNCYKCHGADKVKGELRLDRKDMVFKGGEHGAVVNPGKPLESEIVKRITLPAHDKKASL